MASSEYSSQTSSISVANGGDVATSSATTPTTATTTKTKTEPKRRTKSGSKMAKVLFFSLIFGTFMLFMDFREAQFSPLAFIKNANIEITITVDPCQLLGSCSHSGSSSSSTKSSSKSNGDTYPEDNGDYGDSADTLYIGPRLMDIDFAHVMRFSALLSLPAESGSSLSLVPAKGEETSVAKTTDIPDTPPPTMTTANATKKATAKRRAKKNTNKKKGSKTSANDATEANDTKTSRKLNQSGLRADKSEVTATETGIAALTPAMEDADNNAIVRADFQSAGSDNSNKGLFIHVVGYKEGMASWRSTISELVSAAKTLNATLVEPCVVAGKLYSCESVEDISTAVRLSDVYDLRHAKNFLNGKIVTHEKFVELANYNGANTKNMYYLCLKGRMKKDDECNVHHVKSTRGQQFQPSIDKAYSSSLTNTTVLQVFALGRDSLNTWIHKGRFGLKKAEEQYIKSNLRFTPKEFGRVQAILEKVGIKNNTKFAAIQYRPELKTMNYTRCAHQLLESREVMSKMYDIPKENFILMSPLSLDKRLQWGGVAELAAKDPTSHESLAMLQKEGFKKLEDVFGDDVPDGAILVVWDLILAMTATAFSTCSRCKRNFCKDCNYQGFFSKYTLSLRKERQNNMNTNNPTNQCWLQSKEPLNVRI